MSAGQLHRFRNEMKAGDAVLTYDPSRRVYLVGQITGDYRWDPSPDPDDPNARPVQWRGEVSRDLLSTTSKNSLGRGGFRRHSGSCEGVDQGPRDESWVVREMQDLVAGLLRALGYRTRISAAGPDRGKDIVASPDGFGFESPRIMLR